MATLLKSLQLDEAPTSQRILVAGVEAAINVAEHALREGQNGIENFRRLNAARVNKFGK